MMVLYNTKGAPNEKKKKNNLSFKLHPLGQGLADRSPSFILTELHRVAPFGSITI